MCDAVNAGDLRTIRRKLKEDGFDINARCVVRDSDSGHQLLLTTR